VTSKESARTATLWSIAQFCANEGFPVPPLEEKRIIRDGVPVVELTGLTPDGRKFGLGYRE
jgi:hypothetical protein